MRRRSCSVVVLCGWSVLVALAAAGCASGGTSSPTSATSVPGATAIPGTRVAAPPCPVAKVPVVVSVDQWGDIVRDLAGDCGAVTTIISGSAADPHDHEPTTGDTAAFGSARLVVVNGLGYDTWAVRAVDALPTRPAVVDGGAVVGLAEGANPHIWYGPQYVEQVAAAVTAQLRSLSPGAAAYFDERAVAWQATMQPYRDAVSSVRTVAGGKRYAGSEPVFAYMADAVGLTDVTPEGYRQAMANESEPAPGDVHELQQTLQDKGMDVFIFNIQTEGALTGQLRDAASSSGVPVVEVTETVPPGVDSFVRWQVSQLDALRAALVGP